MQPAHALHPCLWQLRAFPFPLHDDEHDLHSFDTAAIGAAAASFAVSSGARSVLATLYPQDMLALQERAATEAFVAKLKVVAADNRLAATTAAAAVVDIVKEAVLHRLFHDQGLVASAAVTHNDDTALASENVNMVPTGDKDGQAVAAVIGISHASADVSTTVVRHNLKPEILRTLASPSTKDSHASEHFATSASTSAAAAATAAKVSSTAAASAVAALSVSESINEADSLHSILSRLNLLQLEVNIFLFCNSMTHSNFISQEPLLAVFPTSSSLRAATAAAVRRALLHVIPPPSMTDVVRLVHELQPRTSSSAHFSPTSTKMPPSLPPKKTDKTPPPPAASPGNRSKRISTHQHDHRLIRRYAHTLTLVAGSTQEQSTMNGQAVVLQMQMEEDEPPL